MLFQGEFSSVKFLKTNPSKQVCFGGFLLSPRFLKMKSAIGLCTIPLILITQQEFISIVPNEHHTLCSDLYAADIRILWAIIFPEQQTIQLKQHLVIKST